MSCLQAIEGNDTENPFICHIMNLLWLLSDRGIRDRFCWISSHSGIQGNERVDQLAKKTLDQDIDQLASVYSTDLKPLVNSYIQQLVQIKWDVAIHGLYLYLVKPTLGNQINSSTKPELKRLWSSDFELAILRPPSPISCPEDHRLFVTTVVKHWVLTIYAPGVCSITGMSWRILHSWLIEYPLWDNYRDLHSGIPTRSRILLSNMNGQIFYTIHHLNHPRSGGIC